jgi:nucleotide-binding universal stress UspA family protein
MSKVANNADVVVGIDGSQPALDAALWAAAVAEKFDAPLHMLHATPSIGHNLTDSAGAIRAACIVDEERHGGTYLRQARDAVNTAHPGVDVTTESTRTPADEALIVRSHRARMIVVGASQVTTAGALLLGSTTLAVATHARCPVVAWRGTATAPTDAPVVVGVDGTHAAALALDAAFEFAERCAVKLIAVRSWSSRRPLDAVTLPILIDWDALEAAEWTQLTDAVDRANQRHPDVSASCFVQPEHPTSALLAHAAGAQLIVVGSRGRNALTSALLGSVTLNLLHHAMVPVMICGAGSADVTKGARSGT